MRFTKMEGCGNDYVFVDGGIAPDAVDPDGLGRMDELARRISDRHSGVGGDGLILIVPGSRGPISMSMWNADGSRGRLCLNGLRCVAKYAAERLPDLGDVFAVETAAGDRSVRVSRDENDRVVEVEVETGAPDFRRQAIPATGPGAELWGEPFYVGWMDLPGYGVSVGNPHLILWMDEAEAVWRGDLDEIGRRFEGDLRFPEGVNVHLVSRRTQGGILMRSWERGSGATQACGTGAVAAFAVAHRLERVPVDSPVEMPGGTVHVRRREDGSLVLRGPATEVFTGTWSASRNPETRKTARSAP